MLPHFSRQTMGSDWSSKGLLAINYGFDRIRFAGPVPIGARVRLAFKLVDVTMRKQGRYVVRTENTVEVGGRDQPALVAKWLFLLIDHSLFGLAAMAASNPRSRYFGWLEPSAETPRFLSRNSNILAMQWRLTFSSRSIVWGQPSTRSYSHTTPAALSFSARISA